MPKLVVHQDKIQDIPALLKICPFGALEEKNGVVEINANCKMCRLCVRKGPKGAVEYVEDSEPVKKVDKSLWRGIAVYVDQTQGEIHPVTYELIGKARELAAKINQPVYALLMGSQMEKQSRDLLYYHVDGVYVYDSPQLNRFKIEPYAAVFEDFIEKVKPAAILVGATTTGRQLAPRVAAHFHTGLTADCTILDMQANTDLVQIRPAFGGNIMAQILTPNTRPQMATVRYKIMNAPQREDAPYGKLYPCSIAPEKLASRVEAQDIIPKQKEKTIESADVLVVAGRGVKKEEDLKMLRRLAELLGGELACTRPLAECGWTNAKQQVGLSGRTVRPKLMITCGVSGAIQFVAGMDHADMVVAINQDPKAPIFKAANYGLVGDLYEIIPALIEKLENAAVAKEA